MITEYFLFSLPGHREIDHLACLEVLSEAQAVCGSLSIQQIPIRSQADIWRAHAIVNLRPGSVIVVCSGAHHQLQPLDYTFSAILRKAWRADVTLCSIGQTSTYLAGLGVLNGKRVAALPEDLACLERRHGLVRWDSRERVLCDGNLVTSVGFFGATEASLLSLKSVGKSLAADRVAARLCIGAHETRELGAEPARTPLHPAVQRAAEVLNRDPLRPWTTASVAGIACVSQRHLQRLFKAELSCGVLEYVQRLRLEKAMHQFKADPHLTLERVAQAAGFTSTQQLRRIWRKEHGEPPSAIRRRSNDGSAGPLPRPLQVGAY